MLCLLAGDESMSVIFKVKNLIDFVIVFVSVYVIFKNTHRITILIVTW